MQNAVIQNVSAIIATVVQIVLVPPATNLNVASFIKPLLEEWLYFFITHQRIYDPVRF